MRMKVRIFLMVCLMMMVMVGRSMRVEGRDAEGVVEEVPQTYEVLEEVVQYPM